MFTQLLEDLKVCGLFSEESQCRLVPSLMMWVFVEERTYAATKNYMDKIQILFLTVASQRCVFTVQLLRLLLNFMDHKPHGNKESEQLCYYNSVKTGDIFHSFKTVSLPP